MKKLPTLYEILGVAPSATEEEIKEVYRKLVRKLHPDLPKNKERDTERIKDINYAKSILLDTKARKSYDATLALLRRKCAECAGTGVRYKQKGFSSREAVPCAFCKGSGYE